MSVQRRSRGNERTPERPWTARKAALAPPSPLPRRLVLTGVVTGLVGLACVLAVLVRGAVVGFDAPAPNVASLEAWLRVGIGLMVGGGVVAHAGRLFARADGRGQR